MRWMRCSSATASHTFDVSPHAEADAPPVKTISPATTTASPTDTFTLHPQVQIKSAAHVGALSSHEQDRKGAASRPLFGSQKTATPSVGVVLQISTQGCIDTESGGRVFVTIKELLPQT